MTSNCGEPTNVGSNGGLGPLPEPEFGRLSVSHDDGRWCESATGERAFSAQQMRIYAEQQVAAERERLARLAETRAYGWHSLTAAEIRAGRVEA